MRRTALTVLVVALGVSVAEASSITVNDITITTTLVGGAIEVDVVNVPGGSDFGVFGGNGADRAFGFNVVDPDDTVAISDLTDGFSSAGAGVTSIGGGLGDFEFVIDGPHSASDAVLPLHFRVTRDGGFTSDQDLYEPNAVGNIFGAHVHNLDGGGNGGFVGFSVNDLGESPEVAAAPEPASLLLLGTGLAFIARRMRRVAR